MDYKSGKKRFENGCFLSVGLLALVVAVAPFSLGRVDHGLDYTVGHADTDDVQGVPETAMKYHVAGVPDPFKTERKHVFSSSNG
jgi:hypothetical protein